MDDGDDALLRLFIRNWKKDYDDGVTLRSVHNRVTGMGERYDTQLRAHDRRIMEIEAARKAEADVEAKTNPGLLTPQAFPAPQVAVTVGSTGTNVASGGSRVSASVPPPPPKGTAPTPLGPWLRVFQPTLGKAVLIILSAVLGALIRHFSAR